LADDHTQRGTEDSIIRGLVAKGDEAGAMRVAERRGLWTVDDIRLGLATARLSVGDEHGAIRILEGDFEPQGLSGVIAWSDPIRMLAAAGREDLAQSLLATVEHEIRRAELMVDLAIGRAQANEDEVSGALGLIESLLALQGLGGYGGLDKALDELVAAGRYSAASLVADAYGDSETYGRLVSRLLARMIHEKFCCGPGWFVSEGVGGCLGCLGCAGLVQGPSGWAGRCGDGRGGGL